MSEYVTFTSGEIIFEQGYPADCAYIVEEGYVEIFLMHPDGKEERLAVMQEGQMFGELGVLDDAPRNASARALKDVRLKIMDLY